MTVPGPGQPLVSGNDWTILEVPVLGGWEPRLAVSVVVPAHDPVHLPRVLAGLAAQSYPAHLLEVVVVDDGSRPSVVLPEVRPENTRLVPMSGGWGRAATCQQGADHSEGQVLHWLDADMVPDRHEVEAQLRWHHVVDYAVVLGDKVFAEPGALDHLQPAGLRDRLAAGEAPADLARGEVVAHAWIEEILDVTAGLSSAGPRAMRVHAGASASVGRGLFEDAGGMPADLVLGEDIVLGYRLREAGAVFVPDREARSVHLGPSTVMRGAEGVNRYNKPFVTDKVPEFRGHRLTVPRSYEVPYVEAVLPVEGERYEAVRAAVDGLLAGAVPDLVVTLLADWQALTDDRRRVLDDPALDLRLVRAAYVSEPRVRLRTALDERCEATFRLTLPGPGCYPVGKALERLLFGMESDHVGTTRIALDSPGHGAQARLVRTAAASRARRVARVGQDRDGLEEAAYPSRSVTAEQAVFVTGADAPKIPQVRGLVPWGVTRPR